LSHWLQRDRHTVDTAEAAANGSRGVLDLLVQRAGLESYTAGATADAVDVTGS
jgi:hypothetical protein